MLLPFYLSIIKHNMTPAKDSQIGNVLYLEPIRVEMAELIEPKRVKVCKNDQIPNCQFGGE